MNFYHSWLYRHVLNTEWFMWLIVLFLFATQTLLPLLIWYRFKGRQWIKKIREVNRARRDGQHPDGQPKLRNRHG